MIQVLSLGSKAGEGKLYQSYDLGAALTKAKVPYSEFRYPCQTLAPI